MSLAKQSADTHLMALSAAAMVKVARYYFRTAAGCFQSGLVTKRVSAHKRKCSVVKAGIRWKCEIDATSNLARVSRRVTALRGCQLARHTADSTSMLVLRAEEVPSPPSRAAPSSLLATLPASAAAASAAAASSRALLSAYKM